MTAPDRLRSLLSQLTPSQRAELSAMVEQRRRALHARESLPAWFEAGPPTEKGRPELKRWQRDAATRIQRAVEEWSRLPPEARPVWILNIEAPPQSGKSELCKRALGWVMAEHGLSCGYVSYAASLAESHSVRIRSIMRSEEAAAVWPWLLGGSGRRDEAPKTTENEWTIPSPTPDRLGARLMARGRDGAITGRVMGIIALDDLYKSDADYQSRASRNEVDSLLRSSVFPRLQEHGGILLNVGTRWGVWDVRGWIEQTGKELQARGSNIRIETWSYPLRAREGDTMGREPGEYLTSNWTPEKEADARIFYGRMASAVLDCNPRQEEGAVFRPSSLAHTYMAAPREQASVCDRVWLSCDPNRKRTKAGSLAAIHVWGQIGSVRYLLHRWADRASYTELRSQIRILAADWRCMPVLIEGAASGDALVDDLMGQVDGVTTVPVRTEGNRKWVDAQAVAPMLEAGQVLFPLTTHAGCGWVHEVRTVLGSYTGDPNDETDDVDTMTQALLWSRERDFDRASMYLDLASSGY